MFLGKVPNDALWDEIQEQKAKGQYPWTHLSHDQDAEVWIDPAALPADMSRSVNFKSIKKEQSKTVFFTIKYRIFPLHILHQFLNDQIGI